MRGFGGFFSEDATACWGPLGEEVVDVGLVPLVFEVLEERREVVSLAFATVSATAASTADFAAIADSRFSRPSRSLRGG